MDHSFAPHRDWNLGGIPTLTLLCIAALLPSSAIAQNVADKTLVPGRYYVMNNEFDPRLGIALGPQDGEAAYITGLSTPNILFCNGESAYVEPAELVVSDLECREGERAGTWFAQLPEAGTLRILDVNSMKSVTTTNFSNIDDGRLAAVVEVGGFLGLGGQTVAIPLEDLNLNIDSSGNTRIILSEANTLGYEEEDGLLTILVNDTPAIAMESGLGSYMQNESE